MNAASNAFADEFVEFLDKGCSAYHAVQAVGDMLNKASFTELKEEDTWNLARGGKYYFTRGTTSLIAFTVGGAYELGDGFTGVGAHTDSPCLRLKAKTCNVKSGALVLNTQPYGGGLWHTWFDRDLGLAGRVIVSRGDGSRFESKLVRIDRPVARIPNLAIHLTNAKEREAFAVNLHEHCSAFVSMDASACNAAVEAAESSSAPGTASRIHPCLAALLAAEIGEEAKNIVDAELQLIDTQKPCRGGLNNDLIYSGRLDNLCSSYQCARALIDGCNDATDPMDKQRNVRIAFLFDHEEVGSNSSTGAGSSMFMDTLYRITGSLMDNGAAAGAKGGSFGQRDVNDTLLRSLRRSYVVSIDMAHALHPNYPAKHDPEMAPKIGQGLVIKHNANQRYATNTVSATVFREFARREGLPVQEFSVRADAGCGSTIGPIIATLSGIMTVDVGSPQFSMHSIREMMGAADVHTGYAHLRAAFKHHHNVVSTSAF